MQRELQTKINNPRHAHVQQQQQPQQQACEILPTKRQVVSIRCDWALVLEAQRVACCRSAVPVRIPARMQAGQPGMCPAVWSLSCRAPPSRLSGRLLARQDCGFETDALTMCQAQKYERIFIVVRASFILVDEVCKTTCNIQLFIIATQTKKKLAVANSTA